MRAGNRSATCSGHSLRSLRATQRWASCQSASFFAIRSRCFCQAAPCSSSPSRARRLFISDSVARRAMRAAKSAAGRTRQRGRIARSSALDISGNCWSSGARMTSVRPSAKAIAANAASTARGRCGTASSRGIVASEATAKCANQAAATTAGSASSLVAGADSEGMSFQAYPVRYGFRLRMKADFRPCFGFHPGIHLYCRIGPVGLKFALSCLPESSPCFQSFRLPAGRSGHFSLHQ